jgi:hypothetical protein
VRVEECPGQQHEVGLLHVDVQVLAHLLVDGGRHVVYELEHDDVQLAQHCRVCCFNHALHHVVGVLVLHHNTRFHSYQRWEAKFARREAAMVKYGGFVDARCVVS